MGGMAVLRVLVIAAVTLAGLAFVGVGVRHGVRVMPDNKCHMSYSRPSYSKVVVDGMEESRYTLFRYYERESERYLDTPRVPVLFVPGHRGSHQQVRSFASEVLKTYSASQHDVRMDWFTVEFNEEWVGVSGELLVQQSHFVAAAIKQMVRNYKRHMPADVAAPPTSVVVVAHSMGGVVARAALLTPAYKANSINTIITLATPHQRPVYQFDRTMGSLYAQVNTFWRNETERAARGWESPLQDVAVLSIAGGTRDLLVPDGWSALDGLVSTERGVSTTTQAMPDVGLSTDHLCVLWCKQLVTALGRILYGLIDQEAKALRDTAGRVDVFRRMARPWLGDMLGIGKTRAPVRGEFMEAAPAGAYESLADAPLASGALELHAGDMRRAPLWRFSIASDAVQSFALATTLDVQKHVDVLVCAGACSEMVQVRGPVVPVEGMHLLLLSHDQLRAYDTLFVRVSPRAHKTRTDAWLLAVTEGAPPRTSDTVVNVPLTIAPTPVHSLPRGRLLVQRLRPQASLAATLPQRVVVRGEAGCEPAFSPLVVHSVGRMRHETPRNASAEYAVTLFPDWPRTRASGWALISDPRCAATVHMATDIGALAAEWLAGPRHMLQDALIVAAGLVAMLIGLDLHQYASSGLLRGMGALRLRDYVHALGTALGVPLGMMWIGEGVVSTPLQTDDGTQLVYHTGYLTTVFLLACAIVTVSAVAVQLLVWVTSLGAAVAPGVASWALLEFMHGMHITTLVFVSPLLTSDKLAIFVYPLLWLRMVAAAGKCTRAARAAPAGSAVHRAQLSRARILAALAVFYLMHAIVVAGRFFFVATEMLHQWALFPESGVLASVNWALVPHVTLMFMAPYLPIPRHRLGAETFKFLGVVASATVGSLLVGGTSGWQIEYVFTGVASFWLLAELLRTEQADTAAAQAKKKKKQ